MSTTQRSSGASPVIAHSASTQPAPPPEEAGVVPYGVGGLFGAHGVVGSGEPDNVFKSRVSTVGLQGGAGVDGFFTPAISVGVELGGMFGYGFGGENNRGDAEPVFNGFGLSTYASAQLTVWR